MNENCDLLKEEFDATFKDKSGNPRIFNITTNIKLQQENESQLNLHDQAVMMQSFRVTVSDQVGFIDTARLLDLSLLLIEQLENHKRRLIELNMFYKNLNIYLGGLMSLNTSTSSDTTSLSFEMFPKRPSASVEANSLTFTFLLKSICAQYINSYVRGVILAGNDGYIRLIEDILCTEDTFLTEDSRDRFTASCLKLKNLLKFPIINDYLIEDNSGTTTTPDASTFDKSSVISNDHLRAQWKACQAMQKDTSFEKAMSPIKLYGDEMAFPSMFTLGESEFLLRQLNDEDTIYYTDGKAHGDLKSNQVTDEYDRISEFYGPFSHPNLAQLVKDHHSDLHWNARYRLITSTNDTSNSTRSYCGNLSKTRMYGLVNIKRIDSDQVLPDKLVPLNPYRSPSKVRGRGTLPLWGPNYIFVIFAWYWNEKSDQPEIVLMRDPNTNDRIYSLPKGIPHFTNPNSIVLQDNYFPPNLRDLWIEDIRRCSRSTSDSMSLSDEHIYTMLSKAMDFSASDKVHSHDSAGYVVHPLNTENAWVEAIVHFKCINGFEELLASPVPTAGTWDEAFFTYFPLIDSALSLSTFDRQIIMQAIADKIVYRPNRK